MPDCSDALVFAIKLFFKLTVAPDTEIPLPAVLPEWESALMLLEQMQAAGLPPDAYSYSAAISACGGAGSVSRFLCEYDGSRPMLFDLRLDISESRNLASEIPSVVNRMRADLLDWHASMPPDRGPELAVDAFQDRDPTR